MAAAAHAPGGTGTANFKVPRPWEGNNVPKFLTESKDDLRDFIEHVEDIIALAAITDNGEKKRLLTSYLPARKRELWRALAEYAGNSTYDEFKAAVLKIYPEVRDETDGTLEELNTLCEEYRNIRRSEDGRLKRFGLLFKALFTKLSAAPAVLLNKEACIRYLGALERTFAESLRMAINTRSLLKDDLVQPAAAGAGAAAAIERKDDPIQLDDLIKMAERLAKNGATDSSWGDLDAPEIRRSDKFPRVKTEQRDARIEDLEGQVSGLRDAVEVGQKQAKAAHEELMKAFVNSRSTHAQREESEPRSGANQSSYGQERQFGRSGGFGAGVQRGANTGGGGGCYYCDDTNHFARECATKQGHLQKGWITVEDGQQRLGDGGMIPKGRGSPAMRVEEYWQRKGAVGQHMYSEGGAINDDEFDVLRDELRTLRVRLNQLSNSGSAQPTYMAATPAPAPSSQATPAPAMDMETLGRFMFNMMKGGEREQYAQTRGAARMAGNAADSDF